MKEKMNQVSKKVQNFRPITAMTLLVALLCSVVFGSMPTRAEAYTPSYVKAYDGTPVGNTYTATEVSGKTPAQIISGQRVKVTAPFDGFQIYMSNGNAYNFTLSVYKWTDDYATTIATTPLKTVDKTTTSGSVKAESLTWTDGALPAGEYFFVVKNVKSKPTVTTNPNRLGLAEVASNVSKGEYYRVGKLTEDKELALDIRFTEAKPAEGYFAEVYHATYVPVYEGTPTGNTYTAQEVSGKTPAQIISGQRVKVTAPFNGFQIYMASGNAYNFTLSVYKWTDDYETTITTEPLKTIDKTITRGSVGAESLTWTDGALPAGEYFFVVKNVKSKSTVTSNPNRLGLAEVASNVSKGEYYRVGTLTAGKELALDIRFTQEAPVEGYFAFAKDIILGDINLDGDVNVIDLVSLKKKEFNGTGDLDIDDLNRDSKVDADDLGLLRKYLVGAIDFFEDIGLAINELPMVLLK